MSFRDFKFPAVVADLGLTLRQTSLSPTVDPHPTSESLKSRLSKGLFVSQRLNNEKARSEFVVAPLLLELWEVSGRAFGLHSGHDRRGRLLPRGGRGEGGRHPAQYRASRPARRGRLTQR